MENKQSYKILFFGDITGKPGRIAVRDFLSSINAEDKPDFVVANVENASHGFGLTKKNYEELKSYGIDCFTSGNHIWDKRDILDYIEEDEILVRPINYPKETLGFGCRVFDKGGKRIAVINALGQVFMPPVNSPWETIKESVEKLKGTVDIIIVDFHAEATAEKLALGRYLSEYGVGLFVGTHTHVQTADEQIFNNMGYITDVGFCGCPDGVIGMEYSTSVNRFINAIPARYEVAETGRVQVNAVKVVFENNLPVKIDRLNYIYNKSYVSEYPSTLGGEDNES